MVGMTDSAPYHRRINPPNNGTCLVAVTKITQPKANIETWITSEGNAYFVQLQDDNDGDRGSSLSGDDPTVGVRNILAPRRWLNPIPQGDNLEESNFRLGPRRIRQVGPNGNALPPTWIGTCVHTSPIPRSIQKRRQLEESDTHEIFDYPEPRKAVEVAVNLKFSLIAVGMEGYQFDQNPA